MPRATAPLVEVEPSLDAFSAAYRHGRAQLVWTRLVADLETPV
jgi:anthranilate synthase component 1